MYTGTQYAKQLFEFYKSRPILVYFDPDVDGLIAGYFVCKMLSGLGLDYTYYINSNRQHGFKLNPEKLEGYLVISVDFSIDKEILQDIKNRDIVSINIDHHEIQSDFIYWDKGVVINNQYNFEPMEDKYQSGAGVVFEVFKEWYSFFDTEENVALVGITLLSDIRPIEGKKAEEYLRTCYRQDITSPFFKYLIDNTSPSIDYSFGVPKMDRNFIDYSFSPRLNSMFRFNEGIEAVEFILGRGMFSIDKRKLQREYARYLTEIGSLKELSNLILIEINVEDILTYSFTDYCIDNSLSYDFPIPEIETASFIGLACYNIKEAFNKTAVALLKSNNILLRGSNRSKYDGIDYLHIFNENGAVARGHKSAFGILDMPIGEDYFINVNSDIEVVESGHLPTCKIMECNNLTSFCVRQASFIADKNNLVRDDYRTFVKYTGEKITVKTNTDRYQEYLVDGIRVKCFDGSLTVKGAYILPILEKGYVAMYLKNIVL